jgi:hypothetical protein
MIQWTLESTFGMSDMVHLSSVSVMVDVYEKILEILKNIEKTVIFFRN